jgi:hypothetical protein
LPKRFVRYVQIRCQPTSGSRSPPSEPWLTRVPFAKPGLVLARERARRPYARHHRRRRVAPPVANTPASTAICRAAKGRTPSLSAAADPPKPDGDAIAQSPAAFRPAFSWR